MVEGAGGGRGCGGWGVGEVQGRWWPTWPRAARGGSGADDIARWLLPQPPTCAMVGSPARASAVAGRNPIRPRRKGSRGDAESGLGDRTTPAADYPTQRSGGAAYAAQAP